jgi:hypothetical protein
VQLETSVRGNAGKGKADVVLTSVRGNAVVLLNNGNGTFRLAPPFRSIGGPVPWW